MAKLENIFITKRSSENLSGLVGLSLTCQDIGVPTLTLHGPKQMDLLLNLYKYFFAFTGMTVRTNSFVDFKFEDSDLVVNCFPIYESNQSEDKRMVKKIKKESNPQMDDKEMSFLYLCRLKSRPGELLIQKCIELKVPPGPLLGKLKSGEDIVLSDNRVIRSEDVMGPEDKGPLFIVLECPSVDYIDSLVTNETIFENISNEDLSLISVVFHFAPKEVLDDRRYQQWIQRLGDSTQHMALNEDNPSEANVAVNRIQTKLNLIDSFVFPLLHLHKCEDNSESKVIKTKTLTKYRLRPKNIRGIDLETVANIDEHLFREEALSNTSFVDNLNEFQSFVSKQKDVKIQDYPEIIFLGTGSAVPSKVRNTSAIWVNIDSETAFLLDCGEGTYGQLYRFYGEECDSYIKKLKGIYVSHLHADHHLGILQLIKNRSSLTSEPLKLIIPPAVNQWLNKYNENVEKISDSYETVMCQKFVKESDDKILNYLRLKEIKTVLVPHCSHSYGLSFTTKSEPNFKIVYSGDSQPTPNLTRIGQNCDLLIHESSMEDELVDEARLKFHSTTSEAIKMGADMNAKFTILTHFSQRYAKIPVINDKFNERVGIAFDNMRVRMSDLKKLPKMIPSLKCLFTEHIEIMKTKTEHRLKRKEFLSKHYEKELKQK